MIIVTSGHLDSSAQTQKLLLDKIENYLKYINSKEFKTEFGKLRPDQDCIQISCIDEPDPIIRELFKKIAFWVGKNNARIEMTVGRSGDN